MPVICDREVSERDIQGAATWAEFYKSRGFQVLPSRPDDKRPMIRFADYWEKPLPDDTIARWPTSNLQIMCGRHWRLLIVDVDGEEAASKVNLQWGNLKTWVTHSGGEGRHWWFLIPRDYPRELTKGVLWKADEKHSAIERLCDRSLVMVPPSIHPETGKRYQFLARHNPKVVPLPATCPRWILEAKPIDLRPSPPPAPPRPSPVPRVSPSNHVFDRESVLSAITDKVSIAESWGLRVASRRMTHSGWIECHALDRPDKNPSAAIHPETGTFVDRGNGLRLSFFDLGVALGQFHDWRDALHQLGDRFHVR